MAYVIEDMYMTGSGELVSHGFYAGINPKYSDIFNVVPYAGIAKKFNSAEAAQEVADRLNRVGYNFIVKNEYINDEKTIITLPVPLGSTVYQVTTKCGDFCTFQQDLFDKIFPPTEKGRCGVKKPCHTVPYQIYKSKLKFHNMEFVLENWETWVFPTEEAAERRMKEIVEGNRKKMLELGFALREDGYGLVGDIGKLE